MASIKAINQTSIHQIQSGQVIVDLCSVVKELVENSLDAGTTSIDVRFKNHGLDSIEVQDNGNGIAPADFETIALKHYTSKLSDYEDLAKLDTFGFRGEALSSLCALSDFHVVTAQASDGPKGSKLDFEVSGKLKKIAVAAAQKGTIVAVENLFKNLPVRRKELEKNIKREFNKVLSLLHAYACISVGIKFSVSNQIPKGRKVSIFSTKANPSTRENIANVYGAKTLTALVRLDLQLDMDTSGGPSTQSVAFEHRAQGTNSRKVIVQGHVSKPVFGEGRQAPDRQLFYVNARPCALPQVAKAINEVYKGFNVSQSPFIFVDLVMDTNAYDVNVSPDKRTILLHDQTALLESLKAALTQMFDLHDQSMPNSQLQSRKLPSYKPLNVDREALESRRDAEADSAEGSSPIHSDGATSNTQATLRRSPSGLIHDWVSRNADERRVPDVGNSMLQRHKTSRNVHAGDADPKGRSQTPESDEQGLPKLDDEHTAEEAAAANVGGEELHRAGQVPQQVSRSEGPMSSPPQQSQQPPEVQAFNKLLASAGKSAPSREGEAEQETIAVRRYGNPIEPLPAVSQSIRQAEPGPVQNAFDRMRPKRTSADIAQITIGDNMTTAVVGSSESKRRRIREVADRSHASSPLLPSRLRAFAAPGTQMAADNERTYQSSDAEEVEDQSDDEAQGEDIQDRMTDHESGSEELGSEASSHGVLSLPLADNDENVVEDEEDDDELDDEYMDETSKRAREEARVARLIQKAQETAAQPTEENLKRASQILKYSGSRKGVTLNLQQRVAVTLPSIRRDVDSLTDIFPAHATIRTSQGRLNDLGTGHIDSTDAEAQLALTVSKEDFGRMRIVGQFNLGFVLAVRPSRQTDSPSRSPSSDQLFIIDQHAADEKFNFERLSNETKLTAQRLATPKVLELTAIEEEIITANTEMLEANGFVIEYDDSGESPVGQRCRLLTLPTSKGTTFTLSDLEELLHLLSENQGRDIVRPTKVRRMLAMRACRSSIMVGKTLTSNQMAKVVGNMGEMEKPWNCPHGRPTMRHLAGLGAWTDWREDAPWSTADGNVREGQTDWREWVRSSKSLSDSTP